MQLPHEQKLVVADSGDVALAREQARVLADSLGFDIQASEEIVLTVSEIASNLVKHATRGTLSLKGIVEGDRAGLEIESVDSGPGIPNVEQALTDGFSTAGSLGCGLGTVNRLMDQLDITSEGGAGTRLVCRRWLRSRRESCKPCPLAFGAASRALFPLAENGDAFVIKRWAESALVAVIDGLGHGKFAQRAAQTARHYVETHVDQPLADIFRGVARACRATRGVVMAVARFDWGIDKLTFASIGNIEVRVLGAAERMNFIIRRGVLGGNAPSAVVTEHPWRPHQMMILHTDGVKTHWRWDDFPDLANASAPLIAQGLLRRLAKDQDDATVLVVRDDVP